MTLYKLEKDDKQDGKKSARGRPKKAIGALNT